MKVFPISVKEETEFQPVSKGILNFRAIDPFYYELLKGLRAKVEYKMDTLNLRVLAVSSAVAGEGKTMTAIQLAANMASTGRKKVLLIDMDLRKSNIAKELRITQNLGRVSF